MIRHLGQGPFVGRDGLVKLSGTGQGVAPVVVGLGTGLTFQGRQGLVVVTGLILRRRAPVGTGETGRGLLGIAGREGLGALLVGAPPQVRPAEGLGRRRRYPGQADAQQQRQGTEPAPAEGQGR